MSSWEPRLRRRYGRQRGLNIMLVTAGVSDQGHLPESRTSMIASLLGVDAERMRAESASRLMRGRLAIVIEDILDAWYIWCAL